MAGYIPITEADRAHMLKTIGVDSLDDLYQDVPESLRLDALQLEDGLPQRDVERIMRSFAETNAPYDLVLRGASSYDHYIPAAVPLLANKEEFVTTYTPYQAEVSQGVLQGIFEYQTMIAELTTMDASNASVYDGATAAGEAMAMCRERKKIRFLVAETASPMTREVMQTYAYGDDSPLDVVPAKEGHIDLAALEKAFAEHDDICGIYIESPNYYGLIEDVKAVVELAHSYKALVVLGANPFALALYESPRAMGVDIVCGDGQPLGLPMNYGGPTLGFMATSGKLLRKLPGRIIGETTDGKGERAFVLTLQAREQHIRREKASSNICSNQAHCALTASIYMAMMGPSGVQEVAKQCHAKAHYLAKELETIGFSLPYDGPFFHEFVTKTPIPAKEVEDQLIQLGILPGLVIGEHEMLWCVTEKASKEDLDEVIQILKEGPDATDF